MMILENTPASLKGELSRWLIEPKSGIFLGNPSARVRDRLWEKALGKCRDGAVLQVWSSRCPQGYLWRSSGNLSREMVDVEGIALVRMQSKKQLGETDSGPSEE